MVSRLFWEEVLCLPAFLAGRKARCGPSHCMDCGFAVSVSEAGESML